MRWCATWAAVLLLAALPAAAGATAEMATGTVFSDADGDGVQGPDEAGLEGVLLSNGRDVVATGADGRYSLPVTAPGAVFVIRPAAFDLPAGPDGLPAFYRLHVPDGTPEALDLTYAGQPATGPLPERIDFPLLPRPGGAPETATGIVAADPQPRDHRELDFVRDSFLRAVTGLPADFALVAGDIMYDDLALLPRYLSLLGATGQTWFHLPGNHELNFDSPDDARSLETYRAFFGPPDHAFFAGPALVIVLDTVAYEGGDPDRPKGAGRYHGAVRPDQLAFVTNLLAHVPPDMPVVVATHIPLKADREAPHRSTANRAELVALLCGRPHVLTLSGHLHMAERHLLGAEDGCAEAPVPHWVLGTVSGNWWSGPADAAGMPVALQMDGTPRGFYLLALGPDGFALTFAPLGAIPGAPTDAFGAVRLFLAEEGGNAVLYANVATGGPQTELRYRIGDGPEVAMERVRYRDPLAVAIFSRLDLPDWNRPQPNAHLWRAVLPGKAYGELAFGAHAVTVTAADPDRLLGEGRLLVESRSGP